MKTVKPSIGLQEGEVVRVVIRRSRASLIAVWVAEVLVIGAIIAVYIVLGRNMDFGSEASNGMIGFLLVFLIIAAIGSGLVGTYLNFKNKMFVTNRRVIYEKVENLLSNKVKTIELMKIESNSFVKEGILAHVLGYGTLKLATKSDETTYVFPYCDSPKKEIAMINELIEASKRDKMAQMGSILDGSHQMMDTGSSGEK
ncbi:hypothetical protein FWH09_01410 [Candidatus Saccharibacteria bacterium]|nr:hypothetical protein [Candidatus Saccharibacteria bacterium]